MRRLSSRSVYSVADGVLAKKDMDSTIRVQSLQCSTIGFRFHREILHRVRGNVARLLSQINDCMKQSCGDHYVHWIMARYDWQGRCWTTDLQDVDILLAMGRALGMVKIIQPNGDSISCDMPLLQILDRDSSRNERLLPIEERDNTLQYWRYFYLRKYNTTEITCRENAYLIP